jgi:hypothetical protein
MRKKDLRKWFDDLSLIDRLAVQRFMIKLYAMEGERL